MTATAIRAAMNPVVEWTVRDMVHGVPPPGAAAAEGDTRGVSTSASE